MRRSLTSSATAVILGSILLLAPSCATIKSGSVAGAPLGASPKLNPTVFFEDGSVAFIGVDTRAAQYVKDGPLLPLGIGLANRSKGSLTFTRESFVLEDSEGRKVVLASPTCLVRQGAAGPGIAYPTNPTRKNAVFQAATGRC